jgi:hypothetical protein
MTCRVLPNDSTVQLGHSLASKSFDIGNNSKVTIQSIDGTITIPTASLTANTADGYIACTVGHSKKTICQYADTRARAQNFLCQNISDQNA